MSRGAALYDALRHAAEKQMLVDRVREELMIVTKSGKARQLADDFVHYLEKLEYRMDELQRLLDVKPVVRVMNMDGVTIVEGMVKSVDLKKATIKVRQPGTRGRPSSVSFGRLMYRTEHESEDGRAFYGIEQLVRIKVVSISGVDSPRLWR